MDHLVKTTKQQPGFHLKELEENKLADLSGRLVPPLLLGWAQSSVVQPPAQNKHQAVVWHPSLSLLKVEKEDLVLHCGRAQVCMTASGQR